MTGQSWTLVALLLLLSEVSTSAGQDSSSHVDVVSAVAGTTAMLHCPHEFPGGVVQPYTVRWSKLGIVDPIYLLQDGKEPHVQDQFVDRLTQVGTASLALRDIVDEDYGWYKCHIFVQSDAQVEDVQTVSWVLLESTEVDLHFTVEPESVIVLPNETVTLECTTWPTARLMWLKDDQLLNDLQENERVIIDGGKLVVRPGVDDDRRGSSSNGAYRCIAQAADLTLSSKTAHVRVAAVEPFAVIPDVTVEVAEGNLAVLPCHSPVSVPQGITNISKNGNWILSDRLQRLQNGDFQVQSVRKNDEGAYRCSLTNEMLNVTVEASWKIHLVVTVPEGPLDTQMVVTPKNVLAVPLHVNVTLECRANGTPLPVVKWSKYGGDLPQLRHSQRMGTLNLKNIQVGDEGTYVCQAENGYGRPASRFTILNIQKIPLLVRELNLQNQTVNEGTTVIFDCTNKGVPDPNVTWVHNGDVIEPNDRITMKDFKLVLKKVSLQNLGMYQCFVTNDVGTVHSAARLRVFPKNPSVMMDGQRDSSLSGSPPHSSSPFITLPPSNVTFPSGTIVFLPCLLDPKVSAVQLWFRHHRTIDFKKDPRFRKTPSGGLRIVAARPSDSGIYTCMAIGPYGRSSASAYLTISDTESQFVVPGQIPHSVGKNTATQPSVLKYDRHGSRKPKLSTVASKSKDKMVPPSRPEITKLSDESVMVRWTVPENDGLPISFFKLQYKDVSKSNSRWMTVDDEIASHIHSFEVSNLKLGHHYKFRIAAVYSNNDNKLGMNSVKFHLQRDPPMKTPTISPYIVHAEAVGPTAILVRWEYVDIDMIPIEGFFIYYREITSAGNYNKVTVIGGKTDKHIITHLQPKVIYEIKMQSFNLAGTSEFSNIWTQSTLDYSYDQTDVETQVATVAPVEQPCNEMVYKVLSITLGILLLILLAVLFLYARKHCQRHQTSDMVVPKIRKYDDAFHPKEFELQSLTGVKPLNGNVSPITNGHFLTNGCRMTKPCDIAAISPETDVSAEDEESFINTQIVHKPNNVHQHCINDDSVHETAVPEEHLGHSKLPGCRVSLSTFGKADDESSVRHSTTDPYNITS